ncbi:MAG: hypothetical protein JWL92_283 [Candidatus Nomurabacteria bacterium]|nr:hypothetical protein [Candidatus Nomurabacteria bacterium]
MNKKIAIVLLVIIIAVGAYFIFKPKAVVPIDTGISTVPTGSSTTTVPAGDPVVKTPWGVSFYKGTTWNITTTTNSEVILTQTTGEWKGDTITIDYVPATSVTSEDAKFGNISYSYDESKQGFISTSNISGEKSTTATGPVPAIVVAHTADNLPVFPGTKRWLTYIVPLSHTTFLKLNITGSGNTDALKELIKTVKKV